MAWQLAAFEMYSRVSLCALTPSAAPYLGNTLVPSGVAPGVLRPVVVKNS